MKDDGLINELIDDTNKDLDKHNDVRKTHLFAIIILVSFGISLYINKKIESKLFDQISFYVFFILIIIFMIYHIRNYFSYKKFVGHFYNEILPKILKIAYKDYISKSCDYKDLNNDYLDKDTVTYLNFLIDDKAFSAKGVYILTREKLSTDINHELSNNENINYRLSQRLIFKIYDVKELDKTFHLYMASKEAEGLLLALFNRVTYKLSDKNMTCISHLNSFYNNFNIISNNKEKALKYLKIHENDFIKFFEHFDAFTLEIQNGLISINIYSFSPLDLSDSYMNGLPKELSIQKIKDSVMQLNYIKEWLNTFLKRREGYE